MTALIVGTTLAALTALTLLHLLNRGRAERTLIGTIRFIPPSATRQRHLGPLRRRLLFLTRALLITLTGVLVAGLFRSSETPVPRMPGLSALLPAGSTGPLPTPVLAAVNGGTTSGTVTISDSAREGVVMAPQHRPDAWQVAPTPPATRLSVTMTYTRDHAADAAYVRAALTSLDNQRAVDLTGDCALPDCVLPEGTDLILHLGPEAPMDADGPVLTVGAGDPADTPALVNLAPGRWAWTGRFHPDADPSVASGTFPEKLVNLLERVAHASVPSIAHATGADDPPRSWPALLIMALFIAERLLAESRIRVDAR